MPDAIKTVLIITKANDGSAESVGRDVAGFLEEKGVRTDQCEQRLDVYAAVSGRKGRPFDLALVLGGDGTFIGVARRLHGLDVPLLGVNLGQVGFLTGLSREDWRSGLEKVLAGRYSISRRMVLSYNIERKGAVVCQGLAVNDLVIGRGELARLIHLGVMYQGRDISSFRADAVIVSTPTGSTAYSVSAGGPLVHPDISAYCVTPVCAFQNALKPLVLPAEGELRIRVEEDGDMNLTEDGQVLYGLEPGDEVVVVKSGSAVPVVEISESEYFSKLRGKGFLTER